MNAENIVIPFLNRLKGYSPGALHHQEGRVFRGRMQGSENPEKRERRFLEDEEGRRPTGIEPLELRELVNNTIEFDIGQLLQPKSFLYLLLATGLFLFQTNNTLSIINLSLQNEKLRTELDMVSSVLTSQELKVHELQSIHNIAEEASRLGLSASGTPPVELVR